MKNKTSLSRTTEYHIWNGIKNRCYNPNANGFNNYGAKGILMSNEWKNSFSQFLEDMGPRPSSKHSVDRLENSLGYNKDNCKWATAFEQANNRTNNIKIFVPSLNQYLSTKEIREKFSLSIDAIYTRTKHQRPLDEELLHNSKLYTYHGKEYTLKQLNEFTDNDVNRIRSRIVSGWSVEDAVEIPIKGNPEHLIDNELLTTTEVAVRYGVKIFNLRHLLRQGYTAYEAIEYMLHGIAPFRFESIGKRKLYLYQGKKYTLRGLSELSDISIRTIANRLHDGLDPKQAIKESIKKPMLYMYNNDLYTLTELANKVGLRRNTIRNYVNNGFTADEAVKILTK